jgi:hypothetical protein
MSEIEGKERLRESIKARRAAIKDAVPDQQPPTSIKEFESGPRKQDRRKP